MEIDVETVGVPVTLTSDVNLNSSSSAEEINLTTALPSSVFITAEIVDGEAAGNVTELEVSIPSDLDTLLNSDPGVILDDNLEVDLVAENGTRSGGGGGGASDNTNVTSVGGGLTLDDLSGSEWASNFSSTSDRQQQQRQHSLVDFTTQPTSKFVTLDSTNTLPLAVSGLQLSTSNVTGDEVHSSSLSSSFSTSSASVTSLISSTNSSSSSSTSLSTSSATSLSNSLLCASSNVISDKVGSECSNSEGSGSQVLTPTHQESSSPDALSVPTGLVLSNNKNNGSNVLSSATTNNLVSQKLFTATARTHDSMSNSESNSSGAILTNGPSNSLDSSKCAKVDHYMFHET